MIVCVCELSAQCLVPKTDQVADKQCNAQLGVVQVFLTFRPEIPTLGDVSGDVEGRELGKSEFRCVIKRTGNLLRVGMTSWPR